MHQFHLSLSPNRLREIHQVQSFLEHLPGCHKGRVSLLQQPERTSPPILRFSNQQVCGKGHILPLRHLLSQQRSIYGLYPVISVSRVCGSLKSGRVDLQGTRQSHWPILGRTTTSTCCCSSSSMSTIPSWIVLAMLVIATKKSCCPSPRSPITGGWVSRPLPLPRPGAAIRVLSTPTTDIKPNPTGPVLAPDNHRSYFPGGTFFPAPIVNDLFHHNHNK
ncbi:hypothetical protein PIB30_032830 [Stylosanthes scabra]|uniref:Uncharacterized protein n=1 Tax=Stylosanthes scabra TaxID=79078 RepID=A0ABU6ZA10_9FABA|nr:hypothetical protein [Stylosanthes scabra]